MKNKTQQFNGQYVEIRLIDGHNKHEILFKGKARVDDTVEITRLLNNCRLRDVLSNFDREAVDNREFLFGDD